jgi:pimeloyl-ACP methyl ester carboxylesterase
VVIVGMSFGGAVATACAARFNVDGVVLVNPAGIAIGSLPGNVTRLVAAMPRVVADYLAVIAQVCAFLMACGPPTPEAEKRAEPGYGDRMRLIRQYTLEDFLFNPSFFRAYMHTLRDFPIGIEGRTLEADYRKAYERLGPRLAFVLSENDDVVMTDKVAAFASQHLPQAPVKVVPDTSHDLQWERPSTFVALVSEAIESFGPTRRG